MLEHSDANFHTYPTHRVVAFFDNKDSADGVVKDLISAGFKDDLIDESVGEDGLRFLDPDAQYHGFLAKVIRAWHKLAKSEELVYVERIKKELTAGHVLVSVPVLNEDKCQEAAQILKNQGGNYIRYYGIFHVENLD